MKNLYKVLPALLVMAMSVSAAYSPTYTTSDVSPAIIDIIGNVLVAIAGEGATIGQVVALSVILGVLAGAIAGVMGLAAYLRIRR